MVFIISNSVAPFLRRSMATTWAVLLPWRGAVTSGTGADFLALVTFLAALALWAALPLAGAPWADCAPPLAWRSAFGLAGGAGCGGMGAANP